MPLAHAALKAGLRVAGFDTNAAIVSALTGGRSHVDDISHDDVKAMLRQGFMPTTDAGVIGAAETVVICVPTPLAEGGGPDLSAVIAAAETVRDNLASGTLVVLESTTWPGTTEEVLLPILSQSGLTPGKDFHLAFSPERVDPGNRTFGIANTPKVVGGVDESSTSRATTFYRQFVDTVVRATGTREAEMSKLLENTYRQVNIALVNEMAKFCHELDIDFWDVIRCASTKPFGFKAFYPGPGVGGHCIPIDPGYLSHRVKERLGYPFRFVELAQEINRSMPRYVAQRVQARLNDMCRPVKGAKIVLLGVTYKSGIADDRETPARPLAVDLARMGADVRYYDPLVPTWGLHDGFELTCEPSLADAAKKADLMVLLQEGPEYTSRVIGALNVPVLDTRGALSGPRISRL